MPSEFTPARRGVPAGASQSRSRVLTWNGLFAKSISGLGSVKFRLAGICRCCSASTVLISPDTPAARSRWPTLVFTDPMAQPCRAGRSPKALVSAAISMGSPSSVAVPCAST